MTRHRSECTTNLQACRVSFPDAADQPGLSTAWLGTSGVGSAGGRPNRDLRSAHRRIGTTERRQIGTTDSDQHTGSSDQCPDLESADQPTVRHRLTPSPSTRATRCHGNPFESKA